MQKKRIALKVLFATLAICTTGLAIKLGMFIESLNMYALEDKRYPHDLIDAWRKSRKFFGCYDLNEKMENGFDAIKINDTVYALVSYSRPNSLFKVSIMDLNHRIAQDSMVRFLFTTLVINSKMRARPKQKSKTSLNSSAVLALRSARTQTVNAFRLSNSPSQYTPYNKPIKPIARGLSCRSRGVKGVVSQLASVTPGALRACPCRPNPPAVLTAYRRVIRTRPDEVGPNRAFKYTKAFGQIENRE
jgi:hypothetical protein